MFRKVATITLFSTLAITATTFAQRDYRKERAQLAREEKEEKRRMRSEKGERARMDYRPNILRISPITAMDIGVGFGLSYEHLFGPEQMVGLILPVHVMLRDKGDDFFNGNNDFANTQTYVYFTPGLKIYPFGQRRVTYAVGPSLMLGYGGGDQTSYYYVGGYNDVIHVNTFRMGLLVNNYVNFQLTPAFNLGLELGFGIRYIDREKVESPVYDNLGNPMPYRVTSTYDHGMSPTGQFSMTLGYRF